MKPLILTSALVLAMAAPCLAQEQAKPTVSLSVKRQLIGTDNSRGGWQTDAREKTVTLRVTITNTSSARLEGASLTGKVMVERAMEDRGKFVCEFLEPVKLPSMAPNQQITVDLGKVSLRKVEWQRRKFEESLEEWEVLCKLGDSTIGSNLSDPRFKTLEKEWLEEKERHQNQGPPPGGPFRKRPHRPL